MAKKTRYYAVVHGKPSGIFNVWEGGAAPATQGVENAVFKSFTTLEHAEAWYRQNVPPTSRYLSPVYHFETQSVLADAPHTPVMETLEGISPGRHVVFTISNPENNEPFYVGETLNPERSEARHLGGTSRKGNGIALKVRELQAQGIRPVFNIVERHDSKEAALEGKTRLVKAYVQQGFELVNKTREHREIQELYRAPAVRLPSSGSATGSVAQELLDTFHQRVTHDFVAQARGVQRILDLVKVDLGGQTVLGHDLLHEFQDFVAFLLAHTITIQRANVSAVAIDAFPGVLVFFLLQMGSGKFQLNGHRILLVHCRGEPLPYRVILTC